MLYFLLSTLVLTLYIDVVLSLSISINSHSIKLIPSLLNSILTSIFMRWLMLQPMLISRIFYSSWKSKRLRTDSSEWSRRTRKATIWDALLEPFGKFRWKYDTILLFICLKILHIRNLLGHCNIHIQNRWSGFLSLIQKSGIIIRAHDVKMSVYIQIGWIAPCLPLGMISIAPS